MVTADEIADKLKKGACSTTEIQEMTGAGANCGKCLTSIDAKVKNYQSKHPGSLQKRLDFSSSD
jgi:bacterioferritin-associated ferredoxin